VIAMLRFKKEVIDNKNVKIKDKRKDAKSKKKR
jgi:hypothetical protein